MKTHWDTITIVGVNLAVAGLLMALCISNQNQINAVNSRADTLYVMFYDLLKEVKK